MGGAALAFVAVACAWSVYADLFGGNAEPPVTVRPAFVDGDPAVDTEALDDADLYDALFDTAYGGGLPGGHLVPDDEPVTALPQTAFSLQGRQIAPPANHARLVHSIPLPAPRPFPRMADAQNPPAYERLRRPRLRPSAPAEAPSLFERLFGKPQPQANGPTLAYAPTDGGVLGDGQSVTSGRLGAYDRYTAIYDISAHVVYMPDGSKLEAHSGLGSRLDDPSYVHERMRGPTPPSVYDLQLRESLFHGVRAIRLLPVNDRNPFGRTGLLAHTYMLGPNGDSNGCVSFRNYDAFLRAFMNREVKRLVVVARL